MSPFSGSRSLITSKSPLRTNEKALNTQNEWGGASSTAKNSRYAGMLLQSVGVNNNSNNKNQHIEGSFTDQNNAVQASNKTPKHSHIQQLQISLLQQNNQPINIKKQNTYNPSISSDAGAAGGYCSNSGKHIYQQQVVNNQFNHDSFSRFSHNDDNGHSSDKDSYRSQKLDIQYLQNEDEEDECIDLIQTNKQQYTTKSGTTIQRNDVKQLITKNSNNQHVKSFAATNGLITPQNEPLVMMSDNSSMLKLIKQHSTATKQSHMNNKQKSQSIISSGPNGGGSRSNYNHNSSSINKYNKHNSVVTSNFNQTTKLLKDKLKSSIITNPMSPNKDDKNKRPSIFERKSPHKQLQVEKSSLFSVERVKYCNQNQKVQTSQSQTSNRQDQIIKDKQKLKDSMIQDFNIVRIQGDNVDVQQEQKQIPGSQKQEDDDIKIALDLKDEKDNNNFESKFHENNQNQQEQLQLQTQSLRDDDSDDDCDIHIQAYYDSIRYVTIKWNSQHTTLTCGWLISEIMRHLRFEDDFNKHCHIIGMKNMNQKASECYDYLLTQLESPLSFINNGDQLQIITLPEKYLAASLTSGNSNFSPIFSDSNSNQPLSQHNQHLQLTLEDFELIKVIGKGGFSKVFQVRKKDTGKIYAMKTLSKAKIKRDNKVENILNERAILEQVSHPFIIQMKYAFQNDDYLFLILEFCAGGELFYRLNNIPQGRMTEKQAKFYFAEILEAIQYLHDNNILYRDLKPENIVIDESGHVKLTDFGLSKLGFKMGDRAYSFCGSPEYMAPEMLLTEKNRQMGLQPLHHDKALDFYHLGALLHEMLCGLPPFFSEDRQRMYQDIMGSSIQFPAFLSSECQNLLNNLLQKDPSKRLGSQNGAKDIKDHPWCTDIDWDQVFKKGCNPPFKPFSTRSNFDPEYTSMNPILEDEDVLVSLDEQAKGQKTGEFLNEYENRIAKQKISKQNTNQMDHEETKKLIRQHSIELYERENKTFRGYSFLQDPANNPFLNQHTQFGYQDQEGFYFCLAESKDQSFTVGSPIQEFECLSDGEIVLLNNRPSQIQNNQAMNIDQEMIELLQKESHNQQSQQSLLSEGIELMKANINQIQNKRKVGDKYTPQTKVQMQQNYLSKEGLKVIRQQHSKESLYNELLSTFDYSMSKKDKQETNKKNNQNNINNNTHSTMSLFSNSQQNHMGSYLLSSGGEKYHQSREYKQKDDKNLTNQTIKEKIEYQKLNRKYSPEVDLSRALIQTKSKIVTDLSQTIKKQQITNKKNQQVSQSVTQSAIKEAGAYSRTNSNNNTKSNIGGDKKSQLHISEYNTFGNPKQSKLGTKKRTSETNSNRASSPIDKSITKSQSYKKATSNQKLIKGSEIKANIQHTQNQSQINNQLSQTQQISIQSNLKTSQLYSQVKSKVNTNNTRKLSISNLTSPVNNLQNQVVNNDHALHSDEEQKVDDNFQIFQQNEVNLNTNPSEKFIVQQITANELLGSFMAQQSNNSIHQIHHHTTSVNNVLINQVGGDQTIIDHVGNSSLGSLGNERSFEEATNEAITAMILNQSNESCCCSDDEFNQKYNTTRYQITDSPKYQKPTTNQKNVRKLQYNALQESINANQIKRHANNLLFQQQLEEQKTQDSTKNSRKLLGRDPERVFSDLQLPSSKQSANDLIHHAPVNNNQSTNQSIIEQNNFNSVQNQNTKSNTQFAQIKALKSLNHIGINHRYNQANALSSSKVQSPNNLTVNIFNKTTPISPLSKSRQGNSSQNSKLKERPAQKHDTLQSQNSVISANNNSQQNNQTQINNNNYLSLSSQISVLSNTPRGSTTRQSKAQISSSNNNNALQQSSQQTISTASTKNVQNQRQSSNPNSMATTVAHRVQKK